MNQLNTEERSRILAALVEGNSIGAIARMTGKSRNTIDKLLCDLGRACSEYQDTAFRNLRCQRIQCDEIWSFVGAKEKNCTAAMKARGSGRRHLRPRSKYARYFDHVSTSFVEAQNRNMRMSMRQMRTLKS